jgi:hypothetical protein
MTVENTLPFRFKWISASPDSLKTPMRNNLEPQEVFVEVQIPVKTEYIANVEPILKEQLGVDIKESTEPILKPAGMRYALEQLSLQVKAEPVSDDEWDEASDDDEDADWEEDEDEDSDDDWDDDESDEDDEEIDWDDEEE